MPPATIDSPNPTAVQKLAESPVAAKLDPNFSIAGWSDSRSRLSNALSLRFLLNSLFADMSPPVQLHSHYQIFHRHPP
jgi:hypothetical protein